jgi:hypothetical protein
MTDITSYAVFLHEGALTALGEVIKPYLIDGPQGMHLACKEIDSGGAFFEVVLDSLDADGVMIEVELMIPAAMVRLVISKHSEGAFGFRHPLRTTKLGRGMASSAIVPEALPVNRAATAGDKPEGSK